MKKLFFSAMAITLLFSAFLIGYGIFLNETSDSHIETVVSTHTVRLNGETVAYREIQPRIEIDNAILRAYSMNDVTARIDGTVDAICVSRGQAVKRGQTLCRLSNPTIDLQIAHAETEIAKSDTMYRQAKSEMERDQRLLAKGAIALSDAESSASRMKAALSELDAARISRRQLETQRSFQDVTSPTDGFVISVYRDRGSVVSAGAPVMALGDFSRLTLNSTMRDDTVKNIAVAGGPYIFETWFHDVEKRAIDTWLTETFDKSTAMRANILNITPPLEEDALLRNVVWEIENRSSVLEPGIYSRISFYREKPVRVLAVPRAVLYAEHGEAPYVYVSDEDSRLAVRGVRIGVRDNTFIEILEGLEEGDKVVASGVSGLKPGIKVEIMSNDDRDPTTDEAPPVNGIG